MLDLKQRFEELGHDAPDHRPVRDRLDAGHRALRHRRTAIGAVAIAAVVVVGTGTWALGGRQDQAESRPRFATEVTSSPSAGTPIPVALEVEEDSRPPVFYDHRTGQLFRRSGAEVTRRVDDPVPTSADRSVALEVVWKGETTWMYLYWSPNSGGAGSEAPDAATGSFDDWVATLDPDALSENSGYGVSDPTVASPGMSAG